MAGMKDRQNDANVIFLSREVIGTTWSLSALQQIQSEPSYKSLINALHTLMRELDCFELEQNQKTTGKAEGFRDSLWKPNNRTKKSTESSTETFLANLAESVFNGQRRWVQYLWSTKINNKGVPDARQRRKKGPCFNCIPNAWSLRECKEPRNYAHIRQNL